jgi:hypothetical protein
MLREIGINPPVAPRVCVGQRIACNVRCTEAQVIKLGALRLQTCFDIAQTFAPRELTKRQAAELIMAGEVLDLPVAIVARDTPSENVPGQMIHHLRKNVASCMHLPLRDEKSIAKDAVVGQSSNR